MPDTIHTRVEEDRKAAQPTDFNWSDLKKFRKYYRGRQRGTLNADQIRILQGVLGNRFSHNICKKIVNVKANRLEIARFDVEDPQVRAFLFDTWTRNQLPDLFSDSTKACLRDGNTAIGMNWIPDNGPAGGRVALFMERWWDGKTGVFVHYDDLGQPDYAVKEWIDRNRNQIRIIYFPDHIERYVQDGDGWRAFNLPGERGDASTGPVAWLKRDGSPLGIPIIHIPNGNDDDTNYGASELDGGILGIQDQVNTIQHDLTAVSVLSGSPRTTSSGFELEKGDDGKPIQPKTGPGAHWHADDANAKWGVLEAGDIGPLKDALLIKVQTACEMVNVPVHEITGDWPSGEALYRADMDLIKDVETLGKKAGPAWSSVSHRSTELWNTFGRGPMLNEDALIVTVFQPVDKRDPLTLAMVAEKMAPFVSEREVLRILGYSPEKVEEIIQEREEEAEKALERQQAAFSSGVLGGQVPKNDDPNNPGDDPELDE